MSLLNIISAPITSNVLGNNQALPKITTTTLAQVGTSYDAIVKDTGNVVSSTLARSAGDGGQGLLAPISDMKTFVQTADPANISAYETGYGSILSGVNTNISSALSKGASIFDVQRITKESLSGGVNSFGHVVERINPALANPALTVGLGKLPDAGRLIDSSVTGAFNAGTAALNSKISSIGSKVMEKAIADQKASDPPQIARSDSPTPAVVHVNGTALKANKATVKGINEGAPPTTEQNSTDVIFQPVHLFVEGVELPYDGISVTQGIGELPRCSIQIPPNPSLLEIIRGYQPKVHIFYEDKNTGGDRLLFWGHIVACNYSYSQQNGGASISFECLHKNALVQQVTIEWSAGTGQALNGGSIVDPTMEQPSVQINNFSSEYSLSLALQGITGKQTDPKDLIKPTNKDVIKADPTLLDARFARLEKRMVGLPSTLMNMWNQIKLEVYANEKYNVIFSKMFVPLLEDGVRFFDRMSGHNFLEEQIDASRVPPCACEGRPEASKHEALLPPAFRVGIISAVQTKLAIETLKGQLGFSGEMMDFYTMFSKFFMSIEYEMLTLASPAEVPSDPSVMIDPDNLESWNAAEKSVVESIIKPQIPFYYAPICNVLLPNMFNSVQVNQMDNEIPTRITLIDTTASSTQDNPYTLSVSYRAPQSIRESIVIGRMALKMTSADAVDVKTLRDTTGSSYNIPGKYELGRGIVHKKIAMPNWMAHYTKDQDGNRAANNDQQFPSKDSPEGKNLMNLQYAWTQRYGYNNVIDATTQKSSSVRDTSKDTLNPYSPKAGIMAYERLLFNGADYDYSKSVASSRSGTVDALFNPYIVPGYPMDIIDSNANHPSFHAMCSSVTHSITPRGISTNIGFLAAVSYAELSNYFSFPIHPWLQTALEMVNVDRESGESQEQGISPDKDYDTDQSSIKSIQQTIINNPKALEAADKFYRSVLGVGAADPTLMYDFQRGGAKPVARLNGTWIQGSTASDHSPRNGGEGNPNLTGVGNLRLVSRPIEGKKSIESKFGIKFINLTPQNYSQESVMYQNPNLAKRGLLEPGASLFLDYEEVPKILQTVNRNE